MERGLTRHLAWLSEPSAQFPPTWMYVPRATVLSLAVRAGKLEVVRFLLEEGADMDLLPFEADGFTPSAKSLVHVAISEGHVDITRLLLHARRLKEEAERKRWRRRTPFDC